MAKHQDDGAGRCELSELLVTDCSGCQHHEGQGGITIYWQRTA